MSQSCRREEEIQCRIRDLRHPRSAQSHHVQSKRENNRSEPFVTQHRLTFGARAKDRDQEVGRVCVARQGYPSSCDDRVLIGAPIEKKGQDVGVQLRPQQNIKTSCCESGSVDRGCRNMSLTFVLSSVPWTVALRMASWLSQESRNGEGKKTQQWRE